MPAATSATQFLDIPSNITGTALVLAINDRLRAITEALNTASAMPAVVADLNMNGYRVVVLGNPVNAQDAVNLQTAKQLVSAAVSSAAAPQTIVKTVVQSGGTLILSAPGTLAIESSVTPVLSFSAAMSWTTCRLLLKLAPVGAALAIAVNAGGGQLGTATIAAGATSSSATVSWNLPANTVLSIDVTGVGLTFPGSDLTVELS
jgi:hypothetical protein